MHMYSVFVERDVTYTHERQALLIDAASTVMGDGERVGCDNLLRTVNILHGN